MTAPKKQNMQGWPKKWYGGVWVPRPLALVGQKGEECIKGKTPMAMVWRVGGFCDVESAIFGFWGYCLGMISLAKNNSFLATCKGHGDLPLSRMTLLPLFLNSSAPK